MTIHDFTTELFVRVDDAMSDQQKCQSTKHSQALLHPSELVTLGLLFALKGVGNRAFYRWAQANFAPLFPNLPERTRFFRLLVAHAEWAHRFLASPSLLGVVDSFGIELIHPRREGRSDKQIGKKGKSNHRWIVGAKFCVVLDHLGRVVDWAVDTANVYDARFQALMKKYENIMKKYENIMFILGDSGFHVKTTPEQQDPSNLKICLRGTWNQRMLIETVFSMLTHICRLKKLDSKVGHRVWSGLKARLAFAAAAFNVCSQWNGLQADANGVVSLSMLQVAL